MFISCVLMWLYLGNAMGLGNQNITSVVKLSHENRTTILTVCVTIFMWVHYFILIMDRKSITIRFWRLVIFWVLTL